MIHVPAVTANLTRLGKRDVLDACRGRWVDVVLPAVGIPADILDGRHHPCPKCGGTDRFRLIDAAAGAVLCNQCGQGIGDGLRSVQWWAECTFPDAIAKAADAVGMGSSSPPSPVTVEPTRPTRETPSSPAIPDFDGFELLDDREERPAWVAAFCKAKPGVTPEALEAFGAQFCGYEKYPGKVLIRFPAFRFDNQSKPTSFALLHADGSEFGPGTKAELNRGGVSAWVGIAGLREVSAAMRADSGHQVTAWKVEGIADALALYSAIPEAERSRHAVLTRAAGTEGPSPRSKGNDPEDKVQPLRICGRVNIVGDCDDAGQKAAKKWADAVAKVASEGSSTTVVRLPYDAGSKKDVRDYLNDGNTFPDLVALAQESGERVEAKSKPVYRRITCQELDDGDFEIRELIEGTLVADQPCVLAGPQKTLKTTLAIDAGISLATATPFLGKLNVPEAQRVEIMSGESGIATLQETARRIAKSKGLALRDVSKLSFSPDLPRFGDPDHAEALRNYLTEGETNVLMIDPAYLAMPGADAANLMLQGELLRGMATVCSDVGVTPIVLHHASRHAVNVTSHDPLELQDIAWAGWPEFARQWWLINRRSKYVDGSGKHDLWLTVGGSAGHSALWAVDAEEGVRDRYAPRWWDVAVENGHDARKSEQDERRERNRKKKAEEDATKLQEDCESLLRVMARIKQPETKSGLKDHVAISGTRVSQAIAELLTTNQVRPVEFKKNKRMETGYVPVQE